MTTWFGYTSHAHSDLLAQNTCYFQKATCPATGNVDTARFWVESASENINVKHAIYSVVSGSPGLLLGASDAISIASGVAAGLQVFTYSTPVAVVNGVEYALALLANGVSNPYRIGDQTGTGQAYYYKAATYPTFPSDFSGGSSASGITFAQEAGVADPAVAPKSGFLAFV